ncbi:MAG: MCE family protein [Fimbriimonadaceae bacterium]|nr:MCE family protein [Fimbriimonadaceae bacterium]QYK55183.1 MAG: MCE family protein [Fimbriimonadaceae bacterium]
MASAWKVGAFVLVFVGLLVAAFALLQRSIFAKPTAPYSAVFVDAGGLTPGSLVMMSGVVIGKVETVELSKPGQAVARLSIEKAHKIPVGSVAILPRSFVALGEQRLEITPPEQLGEYLQPGATIPGRLGNPLDSLAPGAEGTLLEINKTLVSIRGLLEDEELKGDVTNLMKEVTDTTKKFGNLAQRVDGLVAANSTQFSSLLTTTRGMLVNLQAVSAEVRRMVSSGELEGKAGALLDNLNAAVTQGRGLVSDLQAFANDPKMRASIDETLVNVQQMSASGARIATDAEVMAKNGVTVSEETATLMKKANKIADDVEDLVQKFNQTVGRISERGSSLIKGVEVEAGLTRESNPGRFRSDLNVRFPVGEQNVVAGLYDAFESNRINLQMERLFGTSLGLRYGVYASKPGLGVDYAIAPKIGLRADGYGLNDPRLDLRLRYDFGGGISGWGGVEDLFGGNKAAIGVTIRR